jgi:Zn-dependent M28 family amino/carboxypeptidase
LSVTSLDGVKAENAPVFKVTLASAAGLHALAEGALAGSVVLIETVSFDKLRTLSQEERSDTVRKYSSAGDAIRRLKPFAIIGVRRDSGSGAGATAQLIDPKAEKRRPRPGSAIPYHIHSRELTAAYDALPEGATAATLTFVLPDAVERPVTLKNVAAVLPGSDPALRDSYIIVSAHYDHIGRAGEHEGDTIYNGANDDASGVATVIETASALAAVQPRPRRSILFLALFGEEKGLLGSYYYTRNPLFPLDRTIANLNLEHMGRTDDSEGPQVAKLSMTGFDYSDVGAILRTAALQTGVDFYNREKQSDAFFNRSDNAAFAEAGIPAHTLTVSYEFPDYHALGDHWDKIDYGNLAKVNRTIVAALWSMANRPTAPQWNQISEKTEKYRTARAGEGNKTAQ